MNIIHKTALLQKRRWRIRKRVMGTSSRPRLSLKITGKHFYAQAVDDESGTTILFLGSLDEKMRDLISSMKRMEFAVRLGKEFAERATSIGLNAVVFDRNGRAYHGNVRAFAEAARQGGLQF